MSLPALDRAIVTATLVTSFIPIAMARRAGSSTAEFFTSGPSPDSVPHALAAMVLARLVRTA